MERWRDEAGMLPQQRPKNCPSFSSTLLDAIYHSIDETGDCAETNERCNSGGRDPFSARKKQCDAYSVHRRAPPMVPAEVMRSGREHWGRGNPSPVTRSKREHWSAAAATSSSSDVSSYGGFSSSEAESVTASHPARLRPIRTSSVGSSTFPARFGRHHPSAAPPPPPLVVAGGDEKRGKKEHHGSIRSRLMRELRKGRAPASPGSRFANFLNSLFPAKSKLSGDSVASGEDSACSTASSYSRSCLSKTPSSRGKSGSGKRTVMFNPSSVIVDEDGRPCGEIFDNGGNRPTLRRESAPVRRVSDLLSGSKMEEELEDGESDSSSDLFELENLAVIGRFQDELPVYETTSFSGFSGVSRAMLL